MDETKLINFLKTKIALKDFSFAFSNILYRYYISKKDVSWNLKNMQLVGIGKVIKSNYQLVNPKRPLAWDYEDINTHHFLILLNPTLKELNGLLLPPINHDNYIEWKSFQYAFPLFDACDEGIADKENIVFSNIFNEQVEVEIEGLSEPIPFYDILTDKFKKLSNTIAAYISRGDYPTLSNLIITKIKK